MTIAADSRYRAVDLSWTNNDPIGNELVQLLAKAAGGEWSVVSTYALSASPQSATWNTALPVTAYDVAMRFLNKNVPAIGYESSNPDDWTAATAEGSKSTVETTSAPVTWGDTAEFVDAATPIQLTWISAQTGAPYLLEKDAGAGFVTVVADLVATSYSYTIPSDEVGTTITFCVTAQRGAVVGPTAGTVAVPMLITVGQPTWLSAPFNPLTNVVALSWSAASRALAYLLEKSANGGSSWSTVGTIAATTYSYVPTASELNITMQFRVTGQNGTTIGTASSVQNVATTVSVTAPVLVSAVQAGAGSPFITITWTAGGGDVVEQLAIASGGQNYGQAVGLGSGTNYPFNTHIVTLPNSVTVTMRAESFGGYVFADSNSITVPMV